jgi:2-polyprenyl-6-methoxyphenol hydroxylase-like FAD-dependent oxidoreductase
MMLGFLLARAGVAVVVAEKHVDFLRDFRGDTVHPSTLEMMRELGLLDEFLKLPHSVVKQIALQIGEDRVVVGSLQIHCADAAMGFSQFSRRSRQKLSDIRSADADGSRCLN